MHPKPLSRAIRGEIGKVLLRNWDPIGVRDDPAAADEYDSYVGGVYELLVAGASARAVSEHLVRIETERMGFEDSDPKMLIPLANKLRRLYARLTAPE